MPHMEVAPTVPNGGYDRREPIDGVGTGQFSCPLTRSLMP
jgi:hypothetical protein